MRSAPGPGYFGPGRQANSVVHCSGQWSNQLRVLKAGAADTLENTSAMAAERVSLGARDTFLFDRPSLYAEYLPYRYPPRPATAPNASTVPNPCFVLARRRTRLPASST